MTHSNTNPRPGQYVTHAHSHITRAVAAMDSCFGLVRPHQHGIAVGQKQDEKPYVVCPLLPRRVQSTPSFLARVLPYVGWVCCLSSPLPLWVFSPGSPVFLPPQKPTSFKFQFDQDRGLRLMWFFSLIVLFWRSVCWPRTFFVYEFFSLNEKYVTQFEVHPV